ncbi:hypothetical protein [Jiella pelagia]|uniref:Uncharacterized protein n=1 Tax=Jiella pelagia TaxID=2986949 RepID=A0ABY7C046_9HYPH|nr:hypothetical protein [Jiella pelagia]WAP69449.1 hypothetical protein OH818_04060 [Jiella pelagia]
MPPFLNLLIRSGVICLSLMTADGAVAFSQFEGDTGRFGGGKDGIIAVPLPPLPGTGSQRPIPQSEGSGPAPAAGGQSNDKPEPKDRHRGGGLPGAGGGEVEGTDQGEVPISSEDEEVGHPATLTRPEAPSGKDTPSSPVKYQAEPTAPTREGTGPRVGKPSLQDGTSPAGDAASAVPLAAEIGYGDDKLPEPVKAMRLRLIEAARTGEIEQLRPMVETGDDGTVLSFGDAPKDPIEFLQQNSGDGEGVEILAIMLDLLDSGYARVEPDGSDEIYVWPYFTQVDVAKLTKPQLVELLQIVTAGDYQSMVDFGAYNFYRIGITPDGKMQFFVAGD